MMRLKATNLDPNSFYFSANLEMTSGILLADKNKTDIFGLYRK